VISFCKFTFNTLRKPKRAKAVVKVNIYQRSPLRQIYEEQLTQGTWTNPFHSLGHYCTTIVNCRCSCLEAAPVSWWFRSPVMIHIQLINAQMALTSRITEMEWVTTNWGYNEHTTGSVAFSRRFAGRKTLIVKQSSDTKGKAKPFKGFRLLMIEYNWITYWLKTCCSEIWSIKSLRVDFLL